MTLRVGTATLQRELVPGTFSLSAAWQDDSDAIIAVSVEATAWVTPEGPAARRLTFVLREIELEHDAS